MNKKLVLMALLSFGSFAVVSCGPTPTPTVQIPSNPGSVTAVASGNKVNLSWSAVTGATSYVVERKSSTTAYQSISTTSSTSMTDTLPAAGTYTYRVKSTNSAGTSSGTESAAVTYTVTSPPANTSQARAQNLLGNWAFTYTITSVWNDKLSLSQVLESPAQSGDWFAAGKDEAGNIAVGWYDFTYNTYVVSSGDSSLDQFYEFSSIASDGSVSGVTWLTDGTSYSNDYNMTGKRTGGTFWYLNLLSSSERARAEAIYLKSRAALR